MSLIGRMFVIFFALILSIVAAGFALSIGIIGPDWFTGGGESDPVERFQFFAIAFFTTSFVGVYSFLPALLLVILSEAARFRSFLYYGFAGAAVALVAYFGTNIGLQLENTTDITPVRFPLQLAAASGIIGGLVYWLLAGRNAGRWRDYATL
jgi:hypothetical protein